MSQSMEVARLCLVCSQPAESFNCGVLCCDACKMFFRRTVVRSDNFICRRDGNCFAIPIDRNRSKCRACRIKKCLEVGMVLHTSILDVRQDNFVFYLISSLMSLDTSRERTFMTKFSADDPTIEDIVVNRNEKLKMRDPTRKMEIVDWCFINALTGIKFLLSLEFMHHLNFEEKVTLISDFYLKSSLLFTAYRSLIARRDVLATPEGECIYPDEIKELFTDPEFRRLQSQPVEKFIELQITREEFLLVLVLQFSCSYANELTENSRTILSARRDSYCSALLQLCQLNHQQNSASRFTDLLALCPLIKKCEEKVEYLTTAIRIFKADHPVQKLVKNSARLHFDN